MEIIVPMLFWLLFAVVSAFLAANRGKNSLKWFAVGLLLGPLAFVLAVRPTVREKTDQHEPANPEE